jgi:hypothetical protein
LQEEADLDTVRRILVEGYAPDLNDNEIEFIGRDPFLIAYAIAAADRIIVSTEVSKPTATRQNRRLPDVAAQFGVRYVTPFQMNRALDWRTDWNR